MTALQQQVILQKHGPQFTAALCDYLLKLQAWQWGRRQLAQPTDAFYDDKFRDELVAHHDAQPVWEALDRVRAIREIA